MELCSQETHPKSEKLDILKELLSNLQQISDSYFEMQVKAAILNVEVGTLFDPEIANKLKQSEETCVKCSKRLSDFIEKPVEFSNDEDMEIK